MYKKEILHSEGSEALAQLPIELLVPHPWRCSGLGWMGPWAAVGLTGLYGSFQPNSFCGSMNCVHSKAEEKSVNGKGTPVTCPMYLWL